MRRATLILLAALAAAACSGQPGQEAAKAPAQPADPVKAMEALRAEGGVVRVGAATVTEADLVRTLQTDVSLRHKARQQLGEAVSQAVEMEVRRLLVEQEVKARWLQDPAHAGLRAYLEDQVLYGALEKNVLPERLAVAEAELEAAGLAGKTELLLRQITLPTLAEAREVEARLRKGEDFVAMIRARSTDPAKGNDGRYVDAVGDKSGRFRREDLLHLFGLQDGQYSRILETPLGFAIVRVEGRSGPQGRDWELARNRLRNELYERKVTAFLTAGADQAIGLELEPGAFMAACQSYLEAGGTDAADAEVFRLGDRALRLSTVDFLAEQGPPPVADQTVYQVCYRWRPAAEGARRAMLGAWRARQLGMALDGGQRAEFEKASLRRLVDLHYRRRVASAGAEGEAAARFLKDRPELAQAEELVDLWVVKGPDRAKLEEIRKVVAATSTAAEREKALLAALRQGASVQHRDEVPYGRLAAEEARELGPLQPGEASGCYESGQAWAFEVLVSRRPPSYTELHRKHPEIGELRTQVLEERKEAYLTELRGRHAVLVDWSRVEAIIDRLAAQQ